MGRLLFIACLAAAGCSGAPTARAATAVARTLAPPGCTASGTTRPGLSSALVLPAAVLLAAAGASAQPIPDCSPATGGPALSRPRGAAIAPSPRLPTPDPTDPRMPGEPGRFVCTSADGDTDVVVAESAPNAAFVCRELTGGECECAGRD